MSEKIFLNTSEIEIFSAKVQKPLKLVFSKIGHKKSSIIAMDYGVISRTKGPLILYDSTAKTTSQYLK